MTDRIDPAGPPIADDDATIAAALGDVGIPTLMLPMVHMTGSTEILRAFHWGREIPEPARRDAHGVGNHYYCYAFEPDHDWSECFARQPELQPYFERCLVDSWRRTRSPDPGDFVLS